MSGSVNRDKLVEAYLSGASLPEVARLFGISVSTARYHVKKASALRSRTEAVRNAAKNGKLGSGARGKKRVFSATHRANLRASILAHADETAKGISRKGSGYIEYTRGPHKGRSVHVVRMEERLGRPLKDDECVHHIDGNKANNEDNNLALVTRSGHTRLHRREVRIARETN